MADDLYIVSAPSGAGKTTLLRRVLAEIPDLRFSVSYTTRPPRPQEEHGRDYFFVTPEEFLRLRAEGEFLEWVEQFGYFYGTSRQFVHQALSAGCGVVFDIDVRGAKALKKTYPYAVYIFVLPPDFQVLEQRLRERGALSEAELQNRLAQGRREVEEAHWYDYLVLNDRLEEAVARLKAIVMAQRCRTPRLWPVLSARFGL